MADKLARMQIRSPKGNLSWLYLSGQGAQNYNRDGYEYKATVAYPMDDPRTIDLCKRIDDFWEENKPKGLKLRGLGYSPETVAGENEGDPRVETGNMAFCFSTKVTWPDGKPKVIKVYNAKAAEVHLGDKKPGNGSVGALGGNAAIYINGREAGVSLYLDSIQFTKFVEYSQDVQFEEEEDGFEGDDLSGGFTPASDEPEQPQKEAPAPTRSKARPRI